MLVSDHQAFEVLPCCGGILEGRLAAWLLAHPLGNAPAAHINRMHDSFIRLTKTTD